MVLNIGKNGFLDYPISFGDGRPFGLMPKLREREREWTQVLDAIRFSECVQTAKMLRFLKRVYPQIIHL